MAKYIKCNRANGLVMGYKLHDKPFSLCNPSVFWVAVYSNSPAGLNSWAQHAPNDQVQFQMYQPLPSGNGQPVVNESQGQWTHSINSSNAQEHASRRAEQLRDRETYRLIRLWCERQPEGSEEAFINLGIEDAQNHRYRAYREAANEIRQLRK